MNLKNLKAFFETYKFSEEPIQLDVATTIVNQKKYVENQIQLLESKSGNIAYKPYYERLLKYYNLIK